MTNFSTHIYSDSLSITDYIRKNINSTTCYNGEKTISFNHYLKSIKCEISFNVFCKWYKDKNCVPQDIEKDCACSINYDTKECCIIIYAHSGQINSNLLLYIVYYELERAYSTYISELHISKKEDKMLFDTFNEMKDKNSWDADYFLNETSGGKLLKITDTFYHTATDQDFKKNFFIDRKIIISKLKYIEKLLSERSFYGELNHPVDIVLSIDRIISHKDNNNTKELICPIDMSYMSHDKRKNDYDKSYGRYKGAIVVHYNNIPFIELVPDHYFYDTEFQYCDEWFKYENRFQLHPKYPIQKRRYKTTLLHKELEDLIPKNSDREVNCYKYNIDPSSIIDYIKFLALNKIETQPYSFKVKKDNGEKS